MAIQTAPPLSSFRSIRYWPTWFGISLLYLTARLPHSGRLALGRTLGCLSYALARQRRYISATNIALCFPELNARQQKRLLFDTFIENGIGLIETATGWTRNPADFRHMLKLIGLPALEAALARGKGVLLLGAHYTTLDFSANLMSRIHPIGVTYRPNKNPLFDAFMLRGRLRNCDGVFDRYDLRGAFRHLRQGRILWYAADQDYGPEHAVFAPFFGITAATITTPMRLARFNDCSTFIVRHHRRNRRSAPYEIEFIPLPESFPGKDDQISATLINQHLESAIRQVPAQYLWMHKRFKTRPPGATDSPYIEVKTRVRKVSVRDFDAFIAEARVLEENTTSDRILALDEHFRVRVFPPHKRGSFWRDDPLRRFDRNTRVLRRAGVSTLLVETVWHIRGAALRAAIYHEPEGRIPQPGQDFPLRLFAGFLAELHHKGFMFADFGFDCLLFDGSRFSLVKPDRLHLFPTSLCYADRRGELAAILPTLDDTVLAYEFIRHYREAANVRDVVALCRELDTLQEV